MWLRRLAVAVIAIYILASVRLFFRPSSSKLADPSSALNDPGSLITSRHSEGYYASSAASLGAESPGGLPPPPATLLATFGSASMSDFILNWALNMLEIPTIKPYVVFALDEALYKLCVDNDIPSVLISEVLVHLI